MGVISTYFQKLFQPSYQDLESYLRDKEITNSVELEFWLQEYDLMVRMNNRKYYSGLMD